jgi:hypothetical protein
MHTPALLVSIRDGTISAKKGLARASVLALRILVVAITLLLSSNCASFASENDQSIDIVYDPCARIRVQPAVDTTLEELAAIDAAIDFWKAVAHVDIDRANLESDQTLHIRFEDAALIFRGVYQDEVGDVIVNRRISGADARAITVAHEFGHALGLPHIDDRDSVMNRGNLEFLPLASDVDALSELWGPCVEDDTGPRSTGTRGSP